ncbi:fibromodulin-like isoform X1 [Rhinatrema bivittatum]|uniref:fibromodulin-like isoform X1 n=2 Tax=Rhinatrema bivittatum TaxID=194408 RepID=UPI001125DF84|nr:fibromodulin-like isoform X1 [Rhinatrema bivittatum]
MRSQADCRGRQILKVPQTGFCPLLVSEGPQRSCTYGHQNLKSLRKLHRPTLGKERGHSATWCSDPMDCLGQSLSYSLLPLISVLLWVPFLLSVFVSLQERHILCRMKWVSILIIVSLWEVTLCQYEDDRLWWLSYVQNQFYNYDSFYEEDRAPASQDCPLECDCPPSFPTAMYCDSRNLKHMPYVPSRMKYAYFHNNQITSVQDGAFENATGLMWVVLNKNQISSKNLGRKVFSKLKNLERLYLDNNNITVVPSNLPRSLRELHLSSNQLSRIPSDVLEGLENLTALHLHDNQIQDVGGAFKWLKSLVLLDLSNNNIRKIPEGLPNSLQQLYLEFNQVSTIPTDYFRALPQLQYVRISHNHLTNDGVPSSTFNTTSLLELDLSYNRLQRIPSVSTRLEHFYLQGNRIAEFSIGSFCKVVDITNFSRIQVLRLDGNIIQQNAIPADAPLCLRHASDIDI